MMSQTVETQALLPVPGDLLIARRELKSHVVSYELVKVGTVGLVLYAGFVGKRMHIVLLVEQRWLLFSHKAHTVHLNWERWSPPSPG